MRLDEVAARDQVDRVLPACGGGRVLIDGPDADRIAHAWRRRGVPAEVGRREGICDLMWMTGPQSTMRESAFAALLSDLRDSGVRALVLAVDTPRETWERRVLRHGWRKHPLYQQVTEYAALEHEQAALLVFEPVPGSVSWGAAVDDLAPGRDLHMDMLREAGRRADAHVARYMWARRFVRPGDRVLDAACGLGYGSRIIVDGTLAESVVGIDLDARAIAYATEHYGRARSRLSFAAHDVAALATFPEATFDLIVSFETVEHVADPDRFLADARRLLTPGGRFICSVPNEWVDEHGVDPNPHHLHVFDRERLESLCRRHFLLEHTFGQTAGGGMKHPEAGRALWDAAERVADGEWWLAVAMAPPFGATVDPVSTRWQPAGTDAVPTLTDFARHYEHPWLVRALVSIGQRTESAALRRTLIEQTIEMATADSADRGAALCVRGYGELSQPGGLAPQTRQAIDAYCAVPPANPHVARWHISLRYVQGLGSLEAGDVAEAQRALVACASADPLMFSPLLATKSVSACWHLGWLAIQAGDTTGAARWWRAGIDHAERALQRPWSEAMGDRDRPLLFGLREAALVVDLASQCAAGLHLMPHAAERPGVVADQLAESTTRRLDRQAQAVAVLAQSAAELRAACDEAWRRCSAAEAEANRLRADLMASVVLAPERDGRAPRRVAIFGTGQGGRQALDRLRGLGVGIDCFVDNDPTRWHQRIGDVPVVDPATLRTRGIDVVAVASRPGRDAISAQLITYGYQEGRDFFSLS